MEIGVSIVVMLPWVVVLPRIWLKLLKKIGYSYVLIIPLRSINEDILKSCPLPIRYFQGSWNPGTFWEMVIGYLRKDPQSPKLHDWLFFPNKSVSQAHFEMILVKTDAICVVHDLAHWEKYSQAGHKVLLEVNPHLNMTPQEIVGWASDKGKCLVLDFYHLRRSLRLDELALLGISNSTSKLGSWQQSIKTLLPYTSLIHLSPSRDNSELQDFLIGCPTEFEEMIKFILGHDYDGPMVVEATLGLGGFHILKLIKTMEQMLQRLRSL